MPIANGARWNVCANGWRRGASGAETTTIDFWTAYAVKLGALALVLTALYGIGRRLRNAPFLRSRRHRFVAVVETTALTPQVSLHVLRAGKHHLLVSAGSNGARTLAHWTSEAGTSDVEIGELREFVAGALD